MFLFGFLAQLWVTVALQKVQKSKPNKNPGAGFGTGSKDFELTSTYVTRTMKLGYSEVLFQNGPLTVKLLCGGLDTSVRLEIIVKNEGTSNIFTYFDTEDKEGSIVLAPGSRN
jgi:hypothetical protein